MAAKLKVSPAAERKVEMEVTLTVKLTFTFPSNRRRKVLTHLADLENRPLCLRGDGFSVEVIES